MSDEFDVIVIGAGINGAGIARDAAMRGLKVLLLDKGDIGGGTSSWSTRLIHGGLRYLEHGEVGLVRESLRERACLLSICPHLVRPIRMLVPVYKHARRGLWTIRAGMILYDALVFSRTLPSHRMLSRGETLQQAPGLNSEGLLGAAVYYDAQVEFAERLVVENVLSAVAHGATVLTYARVEKLIIEDSKVRGVEYQGSDHERLTAFAPIVINAAGPWIDQVLGRSPTVREGSIGNTNSPQLIGGTKGSHIIVAPFPGAPDSAIYVEAETDQRPFFIIPWNGKYLIGTTDIRYEGDLDRVRLDDDEINYLLRETNRVVPKAKLTRKQILYTYAGVRPLPFTGDKDEQSITRRHFIREQPALRGLFSIVGGKLTTYRSLAEQTVDLIIKKLPPHWDRGRPARIARANCTTANAPLPGAIVHVPLSASGEGIGEREPGARPHPNPPHARRGATEDFAAFCTTFKQHSPLPQATNDRLLGIYGTRASLLLDLIEKDQSLTAVFDAETGALAAEVVFAFKNELATTLADCLLRRTMVGLNSTRGLTAVTAAGAIAREHLSWSEDQVAREIRNYENQVARFDIQSH